MLLDTEPCPKCGSKWSLNPGSLNYCGDPWGCPMRSHMEQLEKPSMAYLVDELLKQRQETHGAFIDNARISQALKHAMRSETGWAKLSQTQKEAAEMIALKLSRILSGSGDYADHWDDIAGYAKLASKECPAS